MEKPFSQACERNKNPILNVLKDTFACSDNVLEIGSGTGQHAVYFSKKLGHLVWQPSDLKQNMEGIKTWINDSPNTNIRQPIELDVSCIPDRLGSYDAVFAANIFHIMNLSQVESFFGLAGNCVLSGGKLCVYGPFNYEGKYTSESNRDFDSMLRSRDESMGIRDIEWINSLAHSTGFRLVCDHEMPANNRLLEWYKANNNR